MLHRFRVDVLGVEGVGASAGGARWRVAVLTSTAAEGRELLATLSDEAGEISIPRPLGYRIGAADSLLVIATVVGRDADSTKHTTLRLTIDYEPLEGAAGRLPVVPMSENARETDTGRALATDGDLTSRLWQWRPATDGRLLAIVGLPLARRCRLSLDDLLTGEVLWHETFSEEEGMTEQAHGVVRLGVAVQAGRTYRLRMTCPSASTRQSGVVAMMLPVRRETR